MLPRSLLGLLASVSLAAAPAPAPDRVFAEGSDWEVVSTGHRFAEGMAWDAAGHSISPMCRRRSFSESIATPA